jgi:hypothetical protein
MSPVGMGEGLRARRGDHNMIWFGQDICMDVDGLLVAGEERVQLTWMDARVGHRVMTPRYGKPVEVQALWYNTLCTMEALARAIGDEARRKQYKEIAGQTQASFNRLLWNASAGCLYDVVDGDRRDGAIRPNQIFAVSLPFSMLPPRAGQRRRRRGGAPAGGDMDKRVLRPSVRRGLRADLGNLRWRRATSAAGLHRAGLERGRIVAGCG